MQDNIEELKKKQATDRCHLGLGTKKPGSQIVVKLSKTALSFTLMFLNRIVKNTLTEKILIMRN